IAKAGSCYWFGDFSGAGSLSATRPRALSLSPTIRETGKLLSFSLQWGLRNAILWAGYRIRGHLGRHERRSLGAAAAVGASRGAETDGCAGIEISGPHARPARDNGDDAMGVVRQR